MLFSRECAQTQNRENMNTKHPNYKNYRKLMKAYCEYEPENKRQPDAQEDEYFDKVYSPEYSAFSGYKRRLGKDYYRDKLNRSTRAKNKQISRNLSQSVISGNYDLANHKLEFHYPKKTVLWWCL